MKTVILAGGYGSRLAEQTELRPKPLVDIGGRPILWHIMNIYAAQGHTEFIVALGYKGELIKSYFLNYYHLQSDLSISLATNDVKVHARQSEAWLLHLIETGLNTQTGGRLKRLKELIGDETFMMTYGDGVANIDLSALLTAHQQAGRLATVTAVRPPARFGGLTFDGDQVTRFMEKPQLGEGWISGGFFVLEPRVLDYIESDETMFEREPLERLACDGELSVYCHDGFWQGMDTLRDARLLDNFWSSGEAPWKIWS
jgi:glucose-1-phosphate cytidylyltransferase